MIIRHFLMKNATLCKWPLLKHYCNFAVPQKQACPQYRKTKTNKEKQLWSVEKLKIFEFRARLSILFNFSSFRLANMKKYRSSCKTLGISLGRKRDKVSYLHRDVVPKSQKYFVIISKMAAAAVVWEKRKSKRTFVRKKGNFQSFRRFCSLFRPRKRWRSPLLQIASLRQRFKNLFIALRMYGFFQREIYDSEKNPQYQLFKALAISNLRETKYHKIIEHRVL